MIDLATASKQEIFDFVTRGLIDQGRPSVDRQGRCMYRMGDGRRCAVGFLIPEHVYRPSMEGMSLGSISFMFQALDHVSRDVMLLLAKLQEAHDAWALHMDMHHFRDALCRVARAHYLSQAAVFIEPKAVGHVGPTLELEPA